MNRPGSSETSAGTAERPPRERAADLRLVTPALAAWGAAALVLGAPGRGLALAASCGTAAALLVLVPALVRAGARRSGRGASGPGPNTAVAAAAVLLCAAGGALSAAAHAADLHRGPVPELAREHARARVEVEVASDPRLTRPRVRGERSLPVSVLVDAEVTRVTGADGSVVRTRTPVLLIVRPGPGDPRRSPWLALLPSTRLELSARAAPPLSAGDRVAAVLKVPEDQRPEVTGRPTALQRTAGELRAGLRRATDGLAPDARALLPGLVVGDTSRVPDDLDAAFRATDLTHLLAVSGSNLTIVLFLLIGPPGIATHAERRGLAPRLGVTLRGTAVLGGALTAGFVVVCRPEPSVLRAAACGAVVLLAIATGRRRSLVPALAAAVLILVLYDPWLARSYGFLLSVLATGALLTVAPGWSAALQRRGVPARFAEVLAAAAAAQAVCGPVVAVLAARVSLVAVPCNLLAEFAVAPATVLGFAALAAAPLAPPVAEALAWCAGPPAGWIATVARTGAELPGAEADWPGGPSGGLLLAAVTAVVLLVLRRTPGRSWLCAGAALLLLLAVLRPAPLTRIVTGWPPPGWKFALCDVGQGDAAVLAAGEGSAVVVDVGPDPALADRCLRALGVNRIPLLLLTHFHADHVTGLPGALRGRGVGVIQTTGLREPPGQAEFVRRTAEAARIPVESAVPGERRRTGPLDWQVLWPQPGSAPEGPNDASVTLLVRTAGLTLLLLGDLEPPAQQALLRAHPELPPVDVMKVAHHGSAYQDPELLRRARPRLALVSAGAGNPYGHPSPRTLAALEAQGTAVLRTDTDGAITVTGGGRSGGPRATAAGRRAVHRRTDSRTRQARSPPHTASDTPRPASGAGPRTRPGPDRAPGRGRGDRPGAPDWSAWTPHTRRHTSTASAPPGPGGRPPRRCAGCMCAILPPCRSRTSRSTSARRSCWRRSRSSKRS
ncbi:ComEC/Rec2 family competence protein [Streptomyces sp. GC420]|uniref:ComEC/Rec2 family competence protein n=1 Tax=Streptomyces sp. GC420 TaxID=2697568 RepID=UPI001414F276|nr:ComEC/Rec2 family competence protein [Streptomyces sp. GC420]NBM14812.1 MBL fold metallo-hydrolase [Streptomyces sp. GC420]